MRLSKRGFIVEFVGLPGVGKSTVAHAVAGALRSEGMTITEPTYDITTASDRRLRKAFLAGRMMLKCPRSSVVGLYKIMKSRQKTILDFSCSAFNFLYICGLLDKMSGQPGIHLVDQGYYNALWTICFSASIDNPMGAEVGRLDDSGRGYLPDLVLLFEARPETVIARLQQRAGADSRLERQFGTPTFDVQFKAALRALGHVRALLTAVEKDSHGRVRVETFDNDHFLDGTQIDDVTRLVREASQD